jgi:predicted small metal-binding protein
MQEVEDLGLKVKCSDLGMPTCPFVAHGENEEELMADLAQHAKTVHSYTDEQLNDPKMAEQVKAAIKEE